MKRIIGILVGIIVTCVSVFIYDSYLDNQITRNKEAVRNHRSYERYWSRETADLIIDENTLTIFGSSELRGLDNYEDYVASFINAEDMNIMTIGGGNFQSLSHAITLGAIGDSIQKNSNTIALFISPQWFNPEGITKEIFPSRFSEDELLGFLENAHISSENKNYALERVESLLADSPVQQGRVKKYREAHNSKLSLYKPYMQAMSGFWKIKAKNNVIKQIGDMNKELPVVDLKNMNWSNMYQLAEEQGRNSCTNNDFGIYDEYWDTYVKETYEAGEIKEKQQVFVESKEYDDLRFFLNVAEELGIRVLLVSIPVNEKWYAYQGMLCNEYYEKIRGVSKEYLNVELIDMTEYADEKYFLKDIMHLGWKGWTRINEELYKRFMD